MGILFPLLAIIIHHSAVFSTLLKHKCITENKKRDFSTGADPGILEYFFVCVCWGGGGRKFWFKKDRWTYLFVKGEQIIGGYPKTTTFLSIPEMYFGDKMQRTFHLKNSAG